MTKIRIVGWNIGFDKIGMNKLLREDYSYPLDAAKRAVDLILDGGSLELEVSNDKITHIIAQLRALHVVFELSEPEPELHNE